MKAFLKYLGWWFIIALAIITANMLIRQEVTVKMQLEAPSKTCTPRVMPPKSNLPRNA